eukprot:Filipodium_phascolosomae@DN5344_c0_g1_i1.p1
MPQPSELLEQKRMVREASASPGVDGCDGPNSGGGMGGGASGLSYIDGIMVFKDCIKPKWEDPANADGGHFQLILKPSVGGHKVDEYWNNLILGMIGGTIEPYNLITGARLVDKLASTVRNAPQIRIEVWFKDYDSSDRHILKRSLETALRTRLDGTEDKYDELKLEEKPHKK